jgi:lipid II:glycine glycyltransferase (peptidoglycan interpeptide bridge formation enzyme)
MVIHVKTQDNLTSLKTSSHASFLQSVFWKLQKEAFHWKGSYFHLQLSKEESSDIIWSGTVLVLSRFLARNLAISYIAGGIPQTEVVRLLDRFQSNEITVFGFYQLLARALKTKLPNESIALRLDLCYPLSQNPDNHDPELDKLRNIGDSWINPGFSIPQLSSQVMGLNQLTTLKFKRPQQDIQPPDTVLLVLDGKSEDELLAGMKSKHRYNVRLSEKKGVRIVLGSKDSLKHWYDLYKETAKRDKIAIHNQEYYEALWDHLSEAQKLSSDTPTNAGIDLFLAYHEEDLLAGIIVLYWGDMATYVYGASSNHKRNLMPSYALQWAAIKKAKELNCIYYDFYGLPPFANKDHPMFGLFQFKMGFGGELVHYPGTVDFVFRPISYALFKVAEKLRTWYYKVFKKR